MSYYVAAPDFRLVNLLFGLATHHGKLWCYPSQDKLCELLSRFHGRRMSRRTVNRHLGGLVRDGWLTRLRRHRKGASGELELHSTLYTFTRRAVRAFAALRSGLRFLGAGTRVSREASRCDRSGTISVPSEQNRVVAAPSSPPTTAQKEAAQRSCAAMKAILAGR